MRSRRRRQMGLLNSCRADLRCAGVPPCHLRVSGSPARQEILMILTIVTIHREVQPDTPSAHSFLFLLKPGVQIAGQVPASCEGGRLHITTACVHSGGADRQTQASDGTDRRRNTDVGLKGAVYLVQIPHYVCMPLLASRETLAMCVRIDASLSLATQYGEASRRVGHLVWF